MLTKLYWYKATCTNVVDGDTVDIEIDLGFGIRFRERLRLYGIDTSELNSKEPDERIRAIAGKAFVIERVLGKEVVVNTFKDKKDKYGRYLARIYIDDVCVNDELVYANLADSYYP